MMDFIWLCAKLDVVWPLWGIVSGRVELAGFPNRYQKNLFNTFSLVQAKSVQTLVVHQLHRHDWYLEGDWPRYYWYWLEARGRVAVDPSSSTRTNDLSVMAAATVRTLLMYGTSRSSTLQQSRWRDDGPVNGAIPLVTALHQACKRRGGINNIQHIRYISMTVWCFFFRIFLLSFLTLSLKVNLQVYKPWLNEVII